MFERLIPGPATILVVAPLAVLFAVAAAGVAAWLHVQRGVRTPYTRKVFHFLIITAAAGVHLVWGLPGVVTYGSVAAGLVLYAVVRGSGFPLYEALARPGDAPHRSLFVLVPLLTTALGGLSTNLLFPPWAYVGYMAVAWGDAVGEPVGTRWGRHRYRVPSLAGVPATRSLEGSGAVLVTTMFASALALVGGGIEPTSALGASLVIGAVCTAVEAVSHHGLDNLTLQLAAAGTAAFLLA